LSFYLNAEEIVPLIIHVVPLNLTPPRKYRRMIGALDGAEKQN
jgi:hypothetical protein